MNTNTSLRPPGGASWKSSLKPNPRDSINHGMAQHISTLRRWRHQPGRWSSQAEALTKVLDHAPTTFADFVQQNLSRFAANEAN